jgi:hypothetical protein
MTECVLKHLYKRLLSQDGKEAKNTKKKIISTQQNSRGEVINKQQANWKIGDWRTDVLQK